MNDYGDDDDDGCFACIHYMLEESHNFYYESVNVEENFNGLSGRHKNNGSHFTGQTGIRPEQPQLQIYELLIIFHSTLRFLFDSQTIWG